MIQPPFPDPASSTLPVAVAQVGSLSFDTPATLEKLLRWLAEAKAQGARLVVFPEAFLGGYPKGHDFGARVGSRSPEGREWFRRYHAAAVERDGPEVAAVAAAVREADLWCVLGLMERAGGTLYCVAATFGPDGSLRAWRRKLVPTAMERLIWGAGGVGDLGCAQTPWGALSATICWENYVPLLRQHWYEAGVTLYCAPTVDDRDVWLPSMQMIALEGRCFVLSACQYFERRQAPPDFVPVQGDAPETVLIRGGSCILGPLGEVLAGPSFGAETLLCAELDLGAVPRGKFDLDVAGHYARPDLLRLCRGP